LHPAASFVSHSDMGGHGDGVQVMVHRGYAYVGQLQQRHHHARCARSEEPKVTDFIACP
jgi:hypothetical protein